MGVPKSHLDVLVAQDRLKRLEAPASHHKPRGEAVAEIVEVKAIELRRHHRVLERPANVAGRPNAPRVVACEDRQDFVDSLPHGHLAAPFDEGTWLPEDRDPIHPWNGLEPR